MKATFLTAAAAVMIALAIGALAAPREATSATPVISRLTYISKPLYDDESSIGVKFHASRRARPGYEWGIVLFIGGKYAVPGACSSIALSWDRKFGGDSNHMTGAGSYGKLVKGTRYGYWCRGKAWLSIVEHKIGSAAIGRYLGPGSELKFRVLAAP
jgi:hypothetical protein